MNCLYTTKLDYTSVGSDATSINVVYKYRACHISMTSAYLYMYIYIYIAFIMIVRIISQGYEIYCATYVNSILNSSWVETFVGVIVSGTKQE